MKMGKIPLQEEAELCRRRALAYIGLPEATFLMETARAFDDLAAKEDSGSYSEPRPDTAEAA